MSFSSFSASCLLHTCLSLRPQSASHVFLISTRLAATPHISQFQYVLSFTRVLYPHPIFLPDVVAIPITLNVVLLPLFRDHPLALALVFLLVPRQPTFTSFLYSIILESHPRSLVYVAIPLCYFFSRSALYTCPRILSSGLVFVRYIQRLDAARHTHAILPCLPQVFTLLPYTRASI